ncbi:Glycosyl phosphatidyl inositol protein transamidase complex subunit [Actinomortierella ambigua]|nr:Glycosyl phosphatidyl inositol protein transamidase complex subunit [Actinomortierella ambigua]
MYRRADAVRAELSNIGLKAATQNYTLTTSVDTKSGVNTYAVFNAPRADGTEALVLSAPWISKDNQLNTNGIALILSLAKNFRRHSHYARDTIFVITDGDSEGIQAWLRAYHGIERTAQDNHEESLHVRSGAIQAALNLDFAGTGDYNAIGIFFEGVNGGLPNLDLINTVNEIGVHRGWTVVLHDKIIPATDNLTRKYLNALHNMLYMMKYQASCHPSANHGFFHKYMIDAITLYGVNQAEGSYYRFSVHQIGPLVEQVHRSLNNILEHLHQSFFFYLLSDITRYTSIGLYMPPVIILGVSFILKALSMWGVSGDLATDMKAVEQLAERESKEAAGSGGGEAAAVVAASNNNNNNNTNNSGSSATAFASLPFSRRPRPMRVAVSVIGLSLVAGLASFQLFTSTFGFAGETLLVKLVASVGVCTVMVFAGVSSAMIRQQLLLKQREGKEKGKGKKAKEAAASSLSSSSSSSSSSSTLPPPPAPAPDWVLLKTFILAMAALEVTTLSALNFSLAVSIGVLIAVPYLMFQPTHNHVLRILQLGTLMAMSPPGLVLWASYLLEMDVSAILHWVLQGYEVMGTWLLPTICFVYWPLNLASIVMILLPVS